MLLIIIFPNETIPFIEDNLSETECIQIIQKAKELGWYFQEDHYIVESDRIILHARKHENSYRIRSKKKERYYILDEKVLLTTTIDDPNEILPTKELLAFEYHVTKEQIHCIEI